MKSLNPAKRTTIALVSLGAILLASVAVASPATAAYAPNDALTCRTLQTGERACARADAGICAGAGEGFATGLVLWELVITTTNVYSSNTFSYGKPTPAFAGVETAAICTTATCTWASVYANGEFVARSLGVCW